MEIIHTGQCYLRTPSNKDIKDKILEIFRENEGRVQLEELRKDLIDRFNFDPVEIVSKSELEEILNNGQISPEILFYPIKQGVVYQKGYFINIKKIPII